MSDGYIFCPHCGDLYIQPDIKWGDHLTATSLLCLRADIPRPKEFEPMICPLCRTSLEAEIRYYYYHFEKGYEIDIVTGEPV